MWINALQVSVLEDFITCNQGYVESKVWDAEILFANTFMYAIYTALYPGPGYQAVLTIRVLPVRGLKLMEVKQYFQIHTASNWRNWKSSPGLS